MHQWIVICFILYAKSVFSEVMSVYPFPSGLGIAQDIEVFADGKKLNLFVPDGEKPVAAFAFKDSSVIEVRFSKAYQQAEVLPKKYGILTTRINEKSLRFVLKEYQKSKVVVRADGDVKREVLVFGDPPVPAIPKGAIVYAAGVTHVPNDELVLKSGETHYLSPGAVLHARIIVEQGAKNVTLMGPGVIVTYYKGRYQHQLLVKNNCNNIRLDGFLLTNNKFPDYTPDQGYYLDLHQIVIRGVDASDITINNVKTLSDYFTSDALVYSGCHRAVATDCFLMSSDNAIVPGWDKSTQDCKILRTVLYQTRGGYTSAIFPQGSPSASVGLSEIVNLQIKDLYIVQTQGTILGVNFGNTFTRIKNFTIENVYIDKLHIYDPTGQGSWALKNNGNQFIRISKSPSDTAEIFLKNVEWIEDKTKEGELAKGWNLRFDNVTYKGRKITAASEAHIESKGGLVSVNNTTTRIGSLSKIYSRKNISGQYFNFPSQNSGALILLKDSKNKFHLITGEILE